MRLVALPSYAVIHAPKGYHGRGVTLFRTYRQRNGLFWEGDDPHALNGDFTRSALARVCLARGGNSHHPGGAPFHLVGVFIHQDHLRVFIARPRPRYAIVHPAQSLNRRFERLPFSFSKRERGWKGYTAHSGDGDKRYAFFPVVILTGGGNRSLASGYWRYFAAHSIHACYLRIIATPRHLLVDPITKHHHLGSQCLRDAPSKRNPTGRYKDALHPRYGNFTQAFIPRFKLTASDDNSFAGRHATHLTCILVYRCYFFVLY